MFTDRWLILNQDGDIITACHVKYYVKEFLEENKNLYFVLDKETGIKYTRNQFADTFGE